MDIFIIVPPGGYYAERWQHGSLQPPLGIIYIGGMLKACGFEVGIIDAFLEKLSLNKLITQIREHSPKLIGISFCTDNRFEAFSTVKAVKSAFPQIPIIAGGPHPSLTAQDTLENIPEIDIIVRGEGEETILELVKSLIDKKELKNVLGISYRDNGNIIHNSSRPLIRDLDSIPFPARQLLKWEKYNFTIDVPGKGRLRGGTILASRGCPFTCNFCSTSEIWGRKTRSRSVENVLNEIHLLKNTYNIEALWFVDDVFAIDKRNATNICEAMIKEKMDIPWLCEIRVDIADYELIKKMKEAGCFCVSFGVESGSQRVIDNVINKKIKIEKVKQVRDWCRELDLLSNPFFIYSHPEETRDDLQMTLDLIKSWPKKSWIGLKLLHIYPGTGVERVAREKGIIPMDFSWSKPLDSRVEVLRSTQGAVPIFRDRLSWEDLGEAMLVWTNIQKYPIWKKIPKVIKDIRSSKDLVRYLTLLKSLISFKLAAIKNAKA